MKDWNSAARTGRAPQVAEIPRQKIATRPTPQCLQPTATGYNPTRSSSIQLLAVAGWRVQTPTPQPGGGCHLCLVDSLAECLGLSTGQCKA